MLPIIAFMKLYCKCTFVSFLPHAIISIQARPVSILLITVFQHLVLAQNTYSKYSEKGKKGKGNDSMMIKSYSNHWALGVFLFGFLIGDHLVNIC